MVVVSTRVGDDTRFSLGVDGMVLVGLESEQMQQDGGAPAQPYSLNRRLLLYPFSQFSYMGAHT